MGDDKKDKWLEFRLVEEQPKTKVFLVWSKHSDCSLGKIKWHSQWRHYCFFPQFTWETIYSDGCLISIAEFITNLNDEHKRKLKENKQ